MRLLVILLAIVVIVGFWVNFGWLWGWLALMSCVLGGYLDFMLNRIEEESKNPDKDK